MTNTERNKRINQAIRETESLLNKATKKYNDSVICLKMEVAENKELGNSLEANFDWVKYCNEDKARVEYYKNHIEKLKGMMA